MSTRREELRQGLRTLIRSTSEEMASLTESSRDQAPWPGAADRPPGRLRVVELRIDRADAVTRAAVELAAGDLRLSGAAEGSVRTTIGAALAARAALQALAPLLRPDAAAAVEQVRVREVAGEPAVHVVVLVRDRDGEQILVGSVFLRRRSAEETAALAVLNALERSIGAPAGGAPPKASPEQVPS